MDEYFDKILLFMEDKIGLNRLALSDSIWKNAVKERMSACRMDQGESYYKKLIISPTEFQNLVELAIVPETWFFRDFPGIRYICKAVRELHAQGKKKVHIISVGCSSGEEPYSIAIALLEAGLLMDSFLIEGLDISANNIEVARKGLYGANSFRTSSLIDFSRYFIEEKGSKRVDWPLRDKVIFHAENILDPKITEKLLGPYDIIICRNFFIYLHPGAQKQVFQLFEKLLKPENGILIVASTEIELAVKHGFELISGPKNCAFHKQKSKV